MKRHNYPKTVPQKRAAKARNRKLNSWMPGLQEFQRQKKAAREAMR